jgi:CMP/dCMP kinase
MSDGLAPPMPPPPLIVAIDGPAGVGKSSVARRLAQRLGVPYVDTGAMYRALALKALRLELDPRDAAAMTQLGENTRIDHRLEPDGTFVVTLDGEALGAALRTPEVGEAASRVARHSGVRARLVALQRACGRDRGAVMEGRDIGTVVFPDTPHKFFLTADPSVRHQRRLRQLEGSGRPASATAVVDEINRRDARDRERSESPLTHDESYTVIDTSSQSIDEVVDGMARLIRRPPRSPDSSTTP